MKGFEFRPTAHSERPAAEGSRSPNPFPVEPSASIFGSSAIGSRPRVALTSRSISPHEYYSPEARAAMDRVFTGIRRLRPETAGPRNVIFWEGTIVPQSRFSAWVIDKLFKIDRGWRGYWVWRFGGKR